MMSKTKVRYGSVKRALLVNSVICLSKKTTLSAQLVISFTIPFAAGLKVSVKILLSSLIAILARTVSSAGCAIQN